MRQKPPTRTVFQAGVNGSKPSEPCKRSKKAVESHEEAVRFPKDAAVIWEVLTEAHSSKRKGHKMLTPLLHRQAEESSPASKSTPKARQKHTYQVK